MLALKRSKKRKTKEPHTRVIDFGFDKMLNKIDKAINLLDKKA